MRKTILLIATLLLCSGLGAQQFAIFVDKSTAEACHAELEAYRDVLAAEGLQTAILADDWSTPEQVRDRIRQLHREKGLEGAVFVGDIPVAMVRGAQHFTSAFKMDQKNFPMFDSSVPSDRFYDDFGLQFRFLERDSTRHDLFYYWLTGDSEQRIRCDIYTGRIRATLPGEEGFAQIRAYLQKAVAAHRENNPLDRVVSYTGEGSFSNSLSAWKDESITLREQMPAAFKEADGAKFYMFYMYPDIKDVLARELARPDVDLMLFHEHGTPDRQWLTHLAPGETDDELYANGRLAARNLLRRNVRYGADPAATLAKYVRDYGIDSTWFEGWNDPAVVAQDSLDDLKTGIVLEDVRRYNPNPRVVLFDACYNGDFRETDFIAAEYILGNGRTVACLGNSVNVLQDKSSSDLLGLLAEGFRIGEWAQQVHILESHVIGDPTFRFTAPEGSAPVDLHSTDTAYWLDVLRSDRPADVQSLALYRLFDLRYEGLSDLLRELYFQSPYYMQRLQCLHLLPFYADGNYAMVLKAALEDPYEFIRRKAVYYMGKVGRNDFLPGIVQLYLDDCLSERVTFNVWQSIGHLDTGMARELFNEAIDAADWIYDKEAFRKSVHAGIDGASSSYVSSLRAVSDPGFRRYKRTFTQSLRNNPYPALAGEALRKLADPTEDTAYRITLAEALGWYVRAWNRADIIRGCQQILDTEKALDPALADELTKTINRLKEYMR